MCVYNRYELTGEIQCLDVISVHNLLLFALTSKMLDLDEHKFATSDIQLYGIPFKRVKNLLGNVKQLHSKNEAHNFPTCANKSYWNEKTNKLIIISNNIILMRS